MGVNFGVPLIVCFLFLSGFRGGGGGGLFLRDGCHQLKLTFWIGSVGFVVMVGITFRAESYQMKSHFG